MIQNALFGMAKWPFQRLSDLQRGDKRVTQNCQVNQKIKNTNKKHKIHTYHPSTEISFPFLSRATCGLLKFQILATQGLGLFWVIQISDTSSETHIRGEHKLPISWQIDGSCICIYDPSFGWFYGKSMYSSNMPRFYGYQSTHLTRLT